MAFRNGIWELRNLFIFLALFWFYPLIMMSKSMISLSLFYLKFAEFRISANKCPLPNLENFSHYFFKYVSAQIFSPLLPGL